MNEGKLSQDVERGHKADLLLKNELLQEAFQKLEEEFTTCLLYTSPSPRDLMRSRMPSSA